MSLSEQTQAIGTITKTVSELADQSNLLALNAAIEAARAGEQGKSFAVVAQQVRDLSERSKSATVQVRDILDEIQRATNNAVMATEEGSRGVEQGTGQAQDAGEVIKRIANEIESATQTNVQMAAASHEAATGMDQISQAMGAIQQSTNELVAGMRQAEQAARDLQTLAHSLQQASTAYQTQ
jgi:methyl-accepting chemotaxis protein